jgi:hypothetical protein
MISRAPAIASALDAVRRRLGTRRLVEALALGGASAAALLFVALVFAAILAHTSLAGGIRSIGIIGAVAILAVSAWRGSRPVSIDRAAAEADARGDLHDTLKSALALEPQAADSPWVQAFLQRAATSAGQVDVRRILPILVPTAAWVGAGFAGAVVLLVVIAPDIGPHAGELSQTPAPAAAKPGADTDEVKALLEDVAKTADAGSRAKLEKVMAALERPDATDDEKRLALAEAKSALDQKRLETSSNVESLQQLAAGLAGRREFEAVAQALKEGDAGRAAEEMRKLAGGAAKPPSDNADGASRPEETKAAEAAPPGDLEAALQAAAQSKDGGRPDGETQGRMQKAVQGLEELAKKLEVQARQNQATRKLNAVSQALDQKDRGMRAARFGQQEGQKNDGRGSSETGNADIQGGHMYRLGALAREAEPPPGQEGARAGDSSGEAPGDPVVGDEVNKPKAKFEKAGVRGADAPGPDGTDSTFYAASRQGGSKVEYQAVRAPVRYAAEAALEPERIALRHRAQVKGFFSDKPETRQ